LASFSPVLAQQEVINHLITANEYLKAKNEQKAKLEIDSALRISPKDGKANAMMGDLMNKRGELLKALMSYDKAILADPNSAELYIKRAELHIKLNNHHLYVLNDFNKAISLSPTNTTFFIKKAYYQAHTASAEISEPDYSAAAYTLGQAIAFNKTDSELYYLRSKYLFKSKQTLAALADINKAIALSSTNDLYFAQRGYINFMINKYRAAYADYTRAIYINKSKASYYTFRGHANYNLEKYNEAYDDYSKAIDLIISEIAVKHKRISINNPLNKELRQILLYRGMSLVQDNRPYDACDDFERSYQMGESKARNYMRKYCN
jgi:tetratricopeptide (TPR) repeat protein